ncbi:hypothetical protein VNO77_20165 [Canavalia gladiata]|uniref:Uncharacterized protein n=1 Tax=Canavalia gladiata TaxID=3824 RepID=A0AAN9LP18_CANGL
MQGSNHSILATLVYGSKIGSRDMEVGELSEKGNVHSMIRDLASSKVGFYRDGRRADESACNSRDVYTSMHGMVPLIYEIQGTIGLVSWTGLAASCVKSR